MSRWEGIQIFDSPPPLSDGPGVKANTRDDSWTSYQAQLERIAELAIRGSVVIYAVDARGLQTTGLTPADNVTATQSIQGRMAALRSMRADDIVRGREGSESDRNTQTGGFLVHDSNNFELQRVMTDQEGYYLIGFRPDEETFDQKFHHIKARLKRKGLTCANARGVLMDITRRTSSSTGARAGGDQMTMALLSPFAANNVTVRLTTFFVDQAPEGALIRSLSIWTRAI